MRTACIILAILGAILSAALGFKWRKDYDAYKAIVDASVELVSAAGPAGGEVKEKAAEFEKLGTGAWMLIAAGALGLIAAVMVAKRRELPAAGLLAACVVAPLIFSGKTLLTTSLLAIAAVLAFMLSRKPVGVPGPN